MSKNNHTINAFFHHEYPVLEKGSGVIVTDINGKQYLDAIGGVCVVNIGHAVPEILDALQQQAQTLSYAYAGETDNLPRQQLASRLNDWMPDNMGETKVFFCSGGSEANDSAIKLAYQYHLERGNPTKYKIISRWQSYHGNTIGAMSASGRTSWRKNWSPYLLDFPHIQPPYCYRCPFQREYPGCDLDCARQLEQVIQQEGQETISAFLAEPVIGTSMSAVVPPPEYYPLIREICDRYDILFIADEVMSGVGRTGKNWAIEHWQTKADIITSAKGFAGGYASLAAAILSENIWKTIQDGSGKTTHSFTYGGNPLSCAAGFAVLKYIEDHNLVERAGKMGELLLSTLNKYLSDLNNVGDIRGLGLFAGVELVQDRKTKTPFPVNSEVTHRVEKAAFENGLMILGGAPGLINGVNGDHIEIVPPYTINEEQIEFIGKILRKSIQNTTG